MYLTLEGIWDRFRILLMEVMVVGLQFFLRKMEDLKVLIFCREQFE
jgi:hypothetical protein